MIYIKAFTLIAFLFASIMTMINEFVSLYVAGVMPLNANPFNLMATWYDCNPLWLIILWGISGIGMVIFWVIPYIGDNIVDGK